MLTWAERLTLWNQYEILKKLDPDETKQYEINQEILSRGFVQYYPEMNPSIYPEDETMPADLSREVEEFLTMFRAIKWSCDRLGYTPKSHNALFEGFDGNDSGGQFGFAKFVRRKLGKWEELADRPDNSHSMSSLDTYRRMLAKWRALGEKFELTEAEIEEIATAR